MKFKRAFLFVSAIAMFGATVGGCKAKDTDAVDKPLTTNAPPPPPRPDKPEVTPSAGGGGAQTPAGATTTP